MKNLFASAIFIIAFSIATKAQDSTAALLKEPTNWTFEKFPLPPGFAPGIHYKGTEELRFSPGMFKKDSLNYFTYAFAAALDSTTSISKNDISDYLTLYFRGLCSSTAKNRKLAIDTTKITVSVAKKTGTTESIYDAKLNIFGVFTDGAPVKLNMEIKVLTNFAARKTYLFFIASPLAKTDAIWKELYAIRDKFVVPQQE